MTSEEVRRVEPYEAKGTWPDLTDEGADALCDVMTAVNSFYYPGDRSEAIAAAVAWLQKHPQACKDLRLNSTFRPDKADS